MPDPISHVDASLANKRDARSSFASLGVELRPFNILWLVVVGLYTVLMPRPFLEPDFISVGLVLLHATCFAWKLAKIRDGRSVLAITLFSGMLVYGSSWVLMALQARSIVQDLFLNPYYLATLWSELWMPVFWIALFQLASLTMLLAASRTEPKQSRLIIIATFWLLALTPVVYFYPLGRLLYVAKKTEKQEPIVEYEGIDDNARDRQRESLWKLFQIACTEKFEPSESWHKRMERYYEQDNACWGIYHFTQSEPQFQIAVDNFLKREYGLDGIVDASLAAQTLDRLGQERINSETALRVMRVTELVAPHLDLQELTERLTSTHWNRWQEHFVSNARRGFVWDSAPEINRLKPWIYAAWYLDQQLNTQNADSYNELETQIGSYRFHQAPPKPVSCAWRMYFRHYFSMMESDELGLASLSDYAMLQNEKYRIPLCGGYESDEFLRRRWLWSCGADQPLGSTKVKLSVYEMLFLNSKGGRDWRQSNRQYVLELARLSIAPTKPRRTIKNSDAGLAVGALAAMLNVPNSQESWPIPPHLKFLFLDHANEPRPSIAMEFWPDLDEGLDKIDRMSELDRVLLRWNYLARMWPESTPQMFVDCYLKATEETRQNALLGIHRNHVGIPQTIPPHAQLEVMSMLKKSLSEHPNQVGDGVWLWPREIKTSDELETIDYGLAQIDCLKGAEMFLQLNRSRFTESILDVASGPKAYRRFQWTFSETPHRYASMKRVWRDDRVRVFAKDSDPLMRKIATEVIRHRPVPQFMPLLDALLVDEDIEVRNRATEVKTFLANLASSNSKADSEVPDAVGVGKK